MMAAMTAPVKTVLLFECAGIGAQPANVNDASSNYNNYSVTGEGFDVYAFHFGTNNYGHGGEYATGYMGGRGNAGNAKGQFPSPTGRHLDGSNFLMGDGHVKWFRGDAVSTGNVATNSTDPQGDNPAEGTEYGGPGAHAVTFSTK